jgi:hypothetical protein
LKNKLETNDKVVTCLNIYCQEATDKKIYDDFVKNWHERFGLENINSIDIPPNISNIVPLAERLNPYATADAWRTYLNQKARPSTINETIEQHLNEEMDDDTGSQGQALLAGTGDIS